MTEERLEKEAMRYQWYTGYDREDEYDKNPMWAQEMEDKELEESDDEEDYTKPKVKFFDKYDPEYMWIKSDTTVGLIKMR